MYNALVRSVLDYGSEIWGYEKWEEVLPAVYELAFELREFGDCEILRKGKVIGEDVTIVDLDGPIRIRRVVM